MPCELRPSNHDRDRVWCDRVNGAHRHHRRRVHASAIVRPQSVRQSSHTHTHTPIHPYTHAFTHLFIQSFICCSFSEQPLGGIDPAPSNEWPLGLTATTPLIFFWHSFKSNQCLWAGGFTFSARWNHSEFERIKEWQWGRPLSRKNTRIRANKSYFEATHTSISFCVQFAIWVEIYRSKFQKSSKKGPSYFACVRCHLSCFHSVDKDCYELPIFYWFKRSALAYPTSCI